MIHILDHASDPLAAAADWFHRHLAHTGKHVHFLLAVPDEAARARQLLLEHPSAGSAVLLPAMHSLKSFIDARYPPQGSILNTHGQELMLVEVLRAQGFPWQMADELLRWFESLQLSDHPPEDFDAAMSTSALTAFSEDTRKLKLLWNAWQEQLRQEHATTQTVAYSEGLQQVVLEADEHLILLGYDWLHSRELAFVERQLQHKQCTLFAQPAYPLYQQLMAANLLPDKPADAPPSHFYDAVFASNNGPLRTRAEAIKSSSQTRPALDIFTACGNEQEAQAIDIQTRLWLAEGCQSIAIITEDRRLARRCSTLLHRARIPVSDSAGWPLSTTSAAGVLERWLETVETDFYHQSLLDVLKSSFLHNPDIAADTSYHLQLDIIEHEGIPQSLSRYRQAIEQRHRALSNMPGNIDGDLERLLDTLEDAAAPLLALIDTGPQSPCRFLEALTKSLQRLGLWRGYEQDAAGQRIQQELFDMRQALRHRDLQFTWEDFRGWLSRALETHNFRPQRDTEPVRIMNYEQSRLGVFDAVILAGSTSQQLPGAASRHIFFNDSVRHELGLKTWETARQQRFSQFRRLLQAAPRILLTWTAENDGAPAQPSPWLALLQTFHKHVFGDNGEAARLHQFQQLPASHLPSPFPAPTPAATTQPAPALPHRLIPGRISIHGYQQLLRCPYQFFAARGLRLQAREDISEKLGKREYGSLVHLCLQALHTDIARLPGPFRKRFNDTNRHEATELLVEISRQVFEPEAYQDFESRAQWHQWEALIPHIVDWEIRHTSEGWQVAQIETEMVHSFGQSRTELLGKIDRIDIHVSGANALLDYKTGRAPKKTAVTSGEDVQLISYAMLAGDMSNASYLELADKPVEKTAVEKEELEDLIPLMRDRFTDVVDAISRGHGLPAWGDTATACVYCAMSGLCRLGFWDEASHESSKAE